MKAEIVAVVVHHRKFPHVLATVDLLIEQGLRPNAVIVVDNSEDALIAEELSSRLPESVRLLVTENRGYAAAVNDALANTGWLADDNLVAVVTHDVIPHPGCIASLTTAILSAGDIGVVGPTIYYSRRGSMRLWSQGGQRGRINGIPYHVRSKSHPPNMNDQGRIKDREWLDGALTIYRAPALKQHPLDESYFLYFEETDCHLRMRGGGWRVVWVQHAVATQEPAGMPPFLHGRNLTRLLFRHGHELIWPLGLASAAVRIGLREITGRTERGALRHYFAGIRSEFEDIKRAK